MFWFSSIPGARSHLLLGPSPALIIVFVSTPPLRFFSRKVLRLSIGMERVVVNVDAGEHPGRFVGWCAGNDYLL
jgi:hypothetical protein